MRVENTVDCLPEVLIQSKHWGAKRANKANGQHWQEKFGYINYRNKYKVESKMSFLARKGMGYSTALQQHYVG